MSIDLNEPQHTEAEEQNIIQNELDRYFSIWLKQNQIIRRIIHLKNEGNFDYSTPIYSKLLNELLASCSELELQGEKYKTLENYYYEKYPCTTKQFKTSIDLIPR